MIFIEEDERTIKIINKKKKKKKKSTYFFVFAATLPIQIVANTAIIVTIIAYTQGPPEDSVQSAPAPSEPQGPTNNALIASFQANAATNPNAAVISAASFSTTSFLIFTPHNNYAQMNVLIIK